MKFNGCCVIHSITENVHLCSGKILCFEIQNVLFHRPEYYLFCIRFEFVQYDEFLNSVEIKKCDPLCFSLINFNAFKNKFPYETKHLDGRLYVILETNLKPMYT